MRNETKYGRKGIIGALYEKYAAKAKAYFGACLHNEMVAEDLTQDLFLRLLSIDVLDESTAKGLIFTMAKRMVVDKARQYMHEQSAIRHYHEMSTRTTSFSDNVVDMLSQYEQGGLQSMTRRRAQIYLMYFREGKTASEISGLLHIEKRTVENHIYMSRQIMQRHLHNVV